MRSILEFALIAWVGISVVAVLVQLVRIARYRRAAASSPTSSAEQTSSPDAPTINLEERLTAKATAPPEAGSTDQAPSDAMAGLAREQQAPAQTTANQTTTAQAVPQPATAPSAPQPPAAPTTPVSPPPASVHPPAVAPTTVAGQNVGPKPAPTLADLLTGVRLPWNLLPTVDQSRQPSNDRVVLITSEGEPADIGVDVADELERLGFSIAPRGDDTAVATRDGHSLGLQIIENPMAAEIGGVRRFPTATESSVALDIWVE